MPLARWYAAARVSTPLSAAAGLGLLDDVRASLAGGRCRQIGIARLRWPLSSGTSTWYACCSTLARIPTATTRLAPTRIRRPCIRRLRRDTSTWCDCSSERGARLDIRDTLFEGTPLGWAEYLGQQAIAEYLRDTARRTS